MAFQLVRASDDEVVVWQTEHGHIYGFAIGPAGLQPALLRDAPGAAAPAAAFADDALAFATGEASTRRLIVVPRSASVLN